MSLQELRDELKSVFLEREDVVDGLLTALIAGEHVLLLGPPGTAKSATVNALVGAIQGAQGFSWLLTKFSTPEEIFGPISLKGLENDEYRRVTSRKLPEAHVAFLDEIFKANSAILNSLLTLINERVFYNGVDRVECPLMFMVGASNELPEGKELEALFDRFSFKFWVPYIGSPDNMRTLLLRGLPQIVSRVSMEEIRVDALCQIAACKMPDSIIDMVLQIKQDLEEAGLRPSDRTWVKLTGILRAHAVLEGRSEVTEDDVVVLGDVLWREPSERAKIVGLVGARANPLDAEAQKFLDMARESAARFPEDFSADDALATGAAVNKEIKQIVAGLDEMLHGHSGEMKYRKLQAASDEIKGIHAGLVRRYMTAAGM